MTNVSSLTHLEILKGYKDYLVKLYTTQQSDAKQLEVWLVGVVNVFKKSVYSSEVGNTGIISEMNSFVVRFNGYKSSEELSNDFNDLIDTAAKIIDKALSTSKGHLS